MAAMLRRRLLLGTLMIAALVGLCWLDYFAPVPGMWLMPVAVILVILAGVEILGLLRAAGLHPVPWTVHCGNLLLVASSWVPPCASEFPAASLGSWQIVFWDDPALSWAWPLLALALGGGIVFAAEMRRYERPGGVIANLGAGLFALVYVGVMFAFLIHLRMAWGIGALVSLIAVVKSGDIGAYTVGRLLGRHKMSPVLSPGKTVEGAIGALVFACVASCVVFRWLIPVVTPAPLDTEPLLPPLARDFWRHWLAFGVFVGWAGMFGDLAESLLKRDAGRKDSGAWVPGFGGVLDVLDSILLAAPVAWLCWAVDLVR